MLKTLLVASAVIVLIVIAWAVNLLWSAGQFKTIEPHFSGKCITISGLIGAEDITIHPKTGIAYISAYDRRAVSAGKPGGGGIYAYDLNAASPKPVNLTPDVGQNYQPHGISLYVDKKGHDVLFVINHEGRRHTIDIFDIKDWRLYHRKTLSDPMLISPNDLVAVGPNRAYISNDHRYVSGFLRVMEDYLNGGEEISASSVAAVRKMRMLIGAVFDPKFLDCKNDLS